MTTGLEKRQELGLSLHQRLHNLGMVKSERRLTLIQQAVTELAPQAIKAYTHYPYISSEEWGLFCKRAGKLSMRINTIPLSEYDGIPPSSVLEKIEFALNEGIFDQLVVTKAEYIRLERRWPKDPVLLGLINGLGDSFVIAEWGDDVLVLFEEDE